MQGCVMTQRGLCALGCALGLLVLLPSRVHSEERDDPIRTKLAVQNALRRGRDMINAQQYEEAVHLLETELEHVNGSREYLTALRDAYRSYVQQLRLAKRDAEADIYQRRLKVLDPGIVLDAPKPAPDPKPAGDVAHESASLRDPKRTQDPPLVKPAEKPIVK